MQRIPSSEVERGKISGAQLRGVAVAVATFLCVAFVYWPGLHGFWGRDDFAQLAFARLIGSPWSLFVRDHYVPAPGSIFRPLGFASLWLWQALFGGNYFAHACADMLLHIGVSLALFRVVRLSGLERAPAVACTLLFALHPAVLGTALWWSARFDLLAALFTFIALRAAFDYVEQRRFSFLLIALTATLAALLSKEIAVAAGVAVALVWLRWAWRDSTGRAAALRALAALAAVGISFFLWRWAVLGTTASGLVGDASLTAAIGDGVLKWFFYFAGYLSFWPRLGLIHRVVVAVVGIALLTCTFALLANGRFASGSSRSTDVLLCGLCLLLLPSLLQAPVVALNAAPLRSDVSAVEAALQSRLYYLSIGGFVIALSIIVQLTLQRRHFRLRIPIVCLLGLGAFAFGWVSRDAASAYAIRTSAPRMLAEAAVTAVDRIVLPRTRCHVVMLGIEPPSEWSIFVSMDSVVKALSPDLGRVARCFIHANYRTYFYLMGHEVNPADALPYLVREAGGRPLPWLRVGDAAVAYLDPPSRIAASDLADMTLLVYENGVFRNVTADVVEGRLPLDLR